MERERNRGQIFSKQRKIKESKYKQSPDMDSMLHVHAGILQLTCIVGSFMEGQQTRLACSITELRVTFLF